MSSANNTQVAAATEATLNVSSGMEESPGLASPMAELSSNLPSGELPSWASLEESLPEETQRQLRAIVSLLSDTEPKFKEVAELLVQQKLEEVSAEIQSHLEQIATQAGTQVKNISAASLVQSLAMEKLLDKTELLSKVMDSLAVIVETSDLPEFDSEKGKFSIKVKPGKVPEVTPEVQAAKPAQPEFQAEEEASQDNSPAGELKDRIEKIKEEETKTQQKVADDGYAAYARGRSNKNHPMGVSGKVRGREKDPFGVGLGDAGAESDSVRGEG